MADMFNALMQGRQAGQQNRLAQLASQSYGAPQESQQSLLSQMASIDPRAAQAQQGQFQQDEDRAGQQLRGYVEYVNKARASNNPMAVNAALRAGAPLIQRLTGKAAPTEWTPDMDAGWAELEAKVAMTPGSSMGRVQSTYVDDQGQRVAIMADGSQKVLGGNDAGATQQTISINGPDGRPAQYTFDRRTGNYVPAGAGGAAGGMQQAAPQPQASAPTVGQGQGQQLMEQIAASANQMIARGVPADQVDQWAASQMGGGTVSEGMPPAGNQFQNTQPVAPGPSQFVGRRPEDEAAAVESAKLQTQIGFMPVQQQIETQGAIDLARQQSALKTETERAAGQYEKNAALSLYEAGMQGLSEGLDGASTGPIMGRLPAVTASQQIAEGGVAAMAPILKQMFRSAGEGTFTDKDQDLLMAMIPTRTDLPNARDAKLANIDRIVRAKLNQPATNAGSAAPVQIRGAGDYNALPSGATFIDPQGVTRRKR